MAGVSIVGQKKTLDERGWESPVCIPNHVADDLGISPDTQDTEDRFHPWENDPLKRSLELSSEPLEGTSGSHVGDVSQDPVRLPVQKRKLDPIPKKHRHLRKVVRTKRMRKSKRKKKVETHCPGILPTPLLPPQNEEDEVVDKKLTLLSAKEGDPDLPNEVGMRHGVEKFWSCHTHTKHIPKRIMARHSKNVFLSQITILSGSRMEAEGRGRGYHKAIQ